MNKYYGIRSLTSTHRFFQTFVNEIFLVEYRRVPFVAVDFSSSHPRTWREHTVIVLKLNQNVSMNMSSVTYAFGHFGANSCHNFRVNIHPRPGKKSDRYSKSDLVSSIIPAFPLSFHADTHHKLSSFFNNTCVARK